MTLERGAVCNSIGRRLSTHEYQGSGVRLDQSLPGQGRHTNESIMTKRTKELVLRQSRTKRLGTFYINTVMYSKVHVGKLNNRQIELIVDTSVKPVAAQRQRKIPFNLRAKVDSKLNRLQQEDIIEKVPDNDETD